MIVNNGLLGQCTRAAPRPAYAAAVFVDGVHFIVIDTRMWDVVFGLTGTDRRWFRSKNWDKQWSQTWKQP